MKAYQNTIGLFICILSIKNAPTFCSWNNHFNSQFFKAAQMNWSIKQQTAFIRFIVTHVEYFCYSQRTFQYKYIYIFTQNDLLRKKNNVDIAPFSVHRLNAKKIKQPMVISAITIKKRASRAQSVVQDNLQGVISSRQKMENKYLPN